MVIPNVVICGLWDNTSELKSSMKTAFRHLCTHWTDNSIPNIWRNNWYGGKILDEYVHMMGLHQISWKEQIWWPQLPRPVPFLQTVALNKIIQGVQWFLCSKSWLFWPKPDQIWSKILTFKKLFCSLQKYIHVSPY